MRIKIINWILACKDTFVFCDCSFLNGVFSITQSIFGCGFYSFPLIKQREVDFLSAIPLALWLCIEIFTFSIFQLHFAAAVLCLSAVREISWKLLLYFLSTVALFVCMFFHRIFFANVVSLLQLNMQFEARP